MTQIQPSCQRFRVAYHLLERVQRWEDVWSSERLLLRTREIVRITWEHWRSLSSSAHGWSLQFQFTDQLQHDHHSFRCNAYSLTTTLISKIYPKTADLRLFYSKKKKCSRTHKRMKLAHNNKLAIQINATCYIANFTDAFSRQSANACEDGHVKHSFSNFKRSFNGNWLCEILQYNFSYRSVYWVGDFISDAICICLSFCRMPLARNVT